MANFIRCHLQTYSLLKKLFAAGMKKAGKDLKSHLNSVQSPCSDESGNIEPDPFEQIAAPPALRSGSRPDVSEKLKPEVSTLQVKQQSCE